jgi:hypothetical protein
MSSTTLPITPARFAAALADLPISSLHAKITELRNNIAHLQKSNQELEDYIRENADKDCYEALMENKDVIKRFEERIELVKREITEVRGLPLGPVRGGDAEGGNDGGMNGVNGEGVGVGAAHVQDMQAGEPEENDAGLASENGVRGAGMRSRGPHMGDLEDGEEEEEEEEEERTGAAHVPDMQAVQPGDNDAGLASEHGVRGAGRRRAQEAQAQAQMGARSSGPTLGMDEPQDEDGVYL